MKAKERLAHVLYDILKEQCPKADAIYEDSILKLFGEYGLRLLREYRLIESCGVIDGRKLYS